MRIYFDTEFSENGKTLDLLSIGLVREDGKTYYAEPAEADRVNVDPWISENVIPYLCGPILPRAQIAKEIADFVGDKPEFWAYVAAYDWLGLIQLYGRLVDRPKSWPISSNFWIRSVIQNSHLKIR